MDKANSEVLLEGIGTDVSVEDNILSPQETEPDPLSGRYKKKTDQADNLLHGMEESEVNNTTDFLKVKFQQEDHWQNQSLTVADGGRGKAIYKAICDST